MADDLMPPFDIDDEGEDSRIHIGDLRPADIALIKSVASVAAAHAVKDTLTALGIDPSEPFAAQADMIWLRTTRERCETAAGKAMLAIVGLIVAGAAGAFWIGFKASIKAILPFALPLIILLALAAAAWAQEHIHPGKVITGDVGRFYGSWMRPDDRSQSCCDRRDCDSTDARIENGRWRAYSRLQNRWIDIPATRVEREREIPPGAHLCENSAGVICFAAGSGS
jgi:hypothetical protein